MNKRKILTLALSLCMIAILAVGGSIAYLTDTEGAKNTMTVGNVSIVQDETNEQGKDFVDGQKMYPVTGNTTVAVDDDYYTGNAMDPADNWINKIVTVKNDGSEDAYVRTLIAFKMLKEEKTVTDDQGVVTTTVTYMDPIDAFGAKALDVRTKHGLCYNWNPSANADSLYWPKNEKDGQEAMKDCYGSKTDYTHVQIDDDIYVVAVYYYTTNGDSMLKPTERTHPSLVSVALESTVTNEQAAFFKDYEILVVSQAVQTKGFTDENGNNSVCDDALNEAFGAVEEADAATLQSWFALAQ